MSDVIDRQAAIDTLDKHLRTTDVPVSYPGIISALTEWLNELPSAQADSKETSPTHKALDTISRQDAIRIVDGIDTWQAGWRGDAIESMKALPTAQPEPHWIPCSEKLPEANGRYLVTRGLVAAGALWNRVYIANYSNLMGIKSVKIWWQGNVGKSDFERLDDVLAWMPLPEAFKEGQE